jgi:ElaB/YqjD/DUF883 family membrane-anchored ribosome-binding protein
MNNPQNHAKNVRDDAQKAADTARQGAEQAARETAAHARRAADDVSATAELTFEELKAQIESLKADMARLASSASEAGYDYVGSQVNDAMSKAERFTRERPAAAWGIAAGAGFLLAHLLSRR